MNVSFFYQTGQLLCFVYTDSGVYFLSENCFAVTEKWQFAQGAILHHISEGINQDESLSQSMPSERKHVSLQLATWRQHARTILPDPNVFDVGAFSYTINYFLYVNAPWASSIIFHTWCEIRSRRNTSLDLFPEAGWPSAFRGHLYIHTYDLLVGSLDLVICQSFALSTGVMWNISFAPPILGSACGKMNYISVQIYELWGIELLFCTLVFY